MLGLPDYSPLNVVMLWLCSVAKNILPGFFFMFDVSTGLISHLSRLRTLCQRTNSARSSSPSNVALAPFLPWKLRLSPWFSCQVSFLWIFEVRWGWWLNVHHTADVVQVLAQDLGLFTWHQLSSIHIKILSIYYYCYPGYTPPNTSKASGLQVVFSSSIPFYRIKSLIKTISLHMCHSGQDVGTSAQNPRKNVSDKQTAHVFLQLRSSSDT